MKCMLLSVLFILPLSGLAANLPSPTRGQEICYARVYSADHLRAHPAQTIKAVAVNVEKQSDNDTIYTSIYVKDITGTTYSNAGAVLSADGKKALTKITTKTVAGQMDGDGGRYLITSLGRDNVQIKVITELSLDEVDNWLVNDDIEEGTPYKQMSIKEKSPDSIMNLSRQVLRAGSAKSCQEVLDDMTQENE